MKEYFLKLGEKDIGKTKLEYADPAMGVVSGKINFINSISGFELFKNFCENKSNVNEIDEKHKFIDTQVIEDLKVFDEEGNEVKGVGNYITGMDSDGFEISIIGIPYPYYEQEFPHHVIEYYELYK